MLGTVQQELILEAKLHQNRAGAPYVQAGFVPAQPNTERRGAAAFEKGPVRQTGLRFIRLYRADRLAFVPAVLEPRPRIDGYKDQKEECQQMRPVLDSSLKDVFHAGTF
jgi:hypothetical protein